MDRWEYIVICLAGQTHGTARAEEVSALLNRQAKLGWEFICVANDCMFYFKRKVQ